MELKNNIQPDFAPEKEIVLPLQIGLCKDFSGLSTHNNVIILLIIIASGLVNAEYFYSSTAAAYYGFCISVLFFVIGTSFLYSTKNNLLQFKAPNCYISQFLSLFQSHYKFFVVTGSCNIFNTGLFTYKLDYQSKIRKTKVEATVIKDSKSSTPISISGQVFFIISSVFLISCLINLKVFINNGLFNYFAFVIGSGIIITALFFWKYRTVKNTIQIAIRLPFVLFLAWALFVFIQLGIATQYKYYRIAACFVFLISFITLRKNKLASFYKAVAFIATIEGLWCILQYLDKIPSESPDFNVTGSFANPNVVAIFLALSLPALLHLFYKTHSIYLKVISSLMLLIVCIGLLLLECRTALLGGTFSSGLFLILHFNLFKRFSRKYLFLGILAIVILSIPIGRQLYLHKKDSADGRMLIWRISTQMVLDSPMRGYGTGMFEREYNLKQAKAIQEGKLNQSELKNASFVLMAYNDYLEQAVEGGIPGVALFIAMLASFLYSSKKQGSLALEKTTSENSDIHYVAYAGIASLAFMAVFNFTLSAISISFLFCVYAGILCTNNKQLKLVELSIKPNIAKIVFLVLACLTFYITYGQFNQAKAHRKIKRAYDFLASGNLTEAENLLAPLQESQQNSVNYCMVYGNLFFGQQKYTEALYQFNYAKKFSANPTLYEMSARCLLQSKDYKGAITNLNLLTALSPKTMKYKFGLMQVLLADKQIKQARKVAQQIVKMPIINANELTDKYLKEAKKVLKTH